MLPNVCNCGSFVPYDEHKPDCHRFKPVLEHVQECILVFISYEGRVTMEQIADLLYWIERYQYQGVMEL